MKRLLCIWLPNWPWQRLRGARPELDGRAVALHESTGRRQVVACSPAAAQCGVRPGTPADEAAALLSAGPPSPQRARVGAGRGPGTFQLWPYDAHADYAALQQLAEWCRQFAPSVSVLEPADEGRSAWDTLLLNATGCAHLFGGEEALAQRALTALLERGLTARVALAETIGAAWAVAHAALLHAPRRPAPAQLPLTEHGRVPPPGPGWGVVAAGELRLWLRALPVEALRLPEETSALLHQLGVERIEQLWRLPRAELASRLGAPLVRRIDEALAIQDELAAPAPPLETPQARWAFDYPTARHEVLCGVLGRLVTPLLESLRQRTQGLRRAECWFRCQPAEFDAEQDRPAVYSGPPHPAPATSSPTSPAGQRRLALLSLEFFQPTASPRHVVEMFGLRLAERPLPGAVVELGIEVLASGPLEAHQQRLFVDGPERESPRHVAQLIDRLSGRLGSRNVLRPQLTPDAQPESAYRCRPWVGQKSPALRAAPRRIKKRRPGLPAGADSAAPSTDPAAPLAPGAPAHARPLWLCPRPLAVQVWSAAPDGPPQRVRYSGQEHLVAYAWGPERIETGWWRRRAIGRDYYQVETAAGARWWLYRTPSRRPLVFARLVWVIPGTHKRNVVNHEGTKVHEADLNRRGAESFWRETGDFGRHAHASAWVCDTAVDCPTRFPSKQMGSSRSRQTLAALPNSGKLRHLQRLAAMPLACASRRFARTASGVVAKRVFCGSSRRTPVQTKWGPHPVPTVFVLASMVRRALRTLLDYSTDPCGYTADFGAFSA